MLVCGGELRLFVHDHSLTTVEQDYVWKYGGEIHYPVYMYAPEL